MLVPSKNLDLLSGKFTFRQRALTDLARMLDATLATGDQCASP
jgi:hypothetical protein